jgi:predicted RNase H-like HicB family nuclease
MGPEDSERQEELTAIISPEDEGFVAYCPELDIAAYAATPSRSIDHLTDKVAYYARMHEEFADFFYFADPSKEQRQCLHSISTMHSRRKVRDVFCKKVISDDLHIDLVHCDNCYIALCPELNIVARGKAPGSALNHLVESVTQHVQST